MRQFPWMVPFPLLVDGEFPSSVATQRAAVLSGTWPEPSPIRVVGKFPYLPELCDRKNDSSFLSDMGRYEQSSYLLALRQFVRVIPGAKGLVFLPLWKIARPSPWLPPMHRQMLLQLAGCLPGIYILNTLSRWSRPSLPLR